MGISGKLFGSIGQFLPVCATSVPVTARPGYGAWYADKIARSYLARGQAGPATTLLAI